MSLSGCFRMYNAGPGVKLAWNDLFARVFAELSLDIIVIDHGWPDPLDTLWSREDLGCAFMCGWPFARSSQFQAIAAPVPSPEGYDDQPRYRSEFLVRRATGWTTVEETFGSRIGWMVEDSQSGFNAPRRFLASYATSPGKPLFADVIGPLGNPARALAALTDQAVDVIALDCFYLDLLRRHRPEALDGISTVAYTDWTPIPLLVAASGAPLEVVEQLTSRLCTLDSDASYRGLLDQVLVKRFVKAEPSSYQVLLQMADEACELGYAVIR